MEQEEICTVEIKLNLEDSFTVEAFVDASVLELKTLIESVKGGNASHQRLIYSGQILKNKKTLRDYCMSFLLLILYYISHFPSGYWKF
jgi:hypothetical protein